MIMRLVFVGSAISRNGAGCWACWRWCWCSLALSHSCSPLFRHCTLRYVSNGQDFVPHVNWCCTPSSRAYYLKFLIPIAILMRFGFQWYHGFYSGLIALLFIGVRVALIFCFCKCFQPTLESCKLFRSKIQLVRYGGIFFRSRNGFKLFIQVCVLIGWVWEMFVSFSFDFVGFVSNGKLKSLCTSSVSQSTDCVWMKATGWCYFRLLFF